MKKIRAKKALYAQFEKMNPALKGGDRSRGKEENGEVNSQNLAL